MVPERHDELRQLLQGLAESLDITDAQYEAAVKHYEAVGDWLNKDNSPISVNDPKIYPQGSFRLGTMIKPINDADQYDIDLVCELKDLQKKDISQKQLKQMVGDRLMENECYRKMCKERKRCWKLQYADSTHFHMDILPALQDGDSFRLFLENKGFSVDWTDLAIAITDNTLPNYEHIDDNWLHSNPKGYSEWFKERMKIQFDTQRMILAKSLRESIEDVPEYKVKTPLQRSIQILKRHRDLIFPKKSQSNGKPISIIITTLAAHAYNNEVDLLEALINIVDGMPRFILRKDNDPWVENPTIPTENFADEWKKYPEQETKFRQWLQQVRADLDATLSAESLRDMTKRLKPRFGDRIVNEVASKAFPTRYVSANAVASAAPIISITNHSKPWRP
jgi:hypothetical protein